MHQADSHRGLVPCAVRFVHQRVSGSELQSFRPCVQVLCSGFLHRFSGLLLDNALGEFQGFAVFQPIINGVGGNLVSVQASRISTMLHKSSLPNMIPPHTKMYAAPWTALFKGGKYLSRISVLEPLGSAVPI